MREKLIELIGEAQDEGRQQRGMGTFHIRNEEIADHLIANGVTIQRWIPVTERLPDCAETVLAVDRDGIRSTAGRGRLQKD